jgi:tetratricopeptide (TPR) repeat protein
MTTKAGHPQHAVNDYSEAVNVAKALVGQGQVTAVPELAKALHKRADAFRTLGRAGEALQDLEGCIGFRSQLVQQTKDPDMVGELGKAFLTQGILLIAANQAPQAAQSLDQANSIFTNLVEGQGRKEFSSELAQGLIQRVSLSSDKSDPALRQVLIKAVDLVNQQAKEGRPVGKDFSIECLRTVVELLQREDFDTVGSLIDSVLNLIETVVTDNKSEQDFVKLTDLLLAASAGLIDDRRTARRPHFLSLACVSCNREIQMFGKNSLPRLVYCLYELGQALERSKPPAVLNYIGSSFALLGELAIQQQTNEDFLRELKMMVSTWRSLPPQIPALANVSRHTLSQLLRLT